MTASFYDRRSLLELTRRWNEVLAAGGLALRLQGASAIEEWKRHAVGGFLFLASDGSRGGTVELSAPLVPEQVLDQLGVGDGWLISADLSWAVHADHHGFLPVRLFGNPENAALPSSDTFLSATPLPAHGSSRQVTGESKLRRDGKHCPICLAPLKPNAGRTRRVRECAACGAHPQPTKVCRRCSATAGAIWESRQGAGCMTCGLHGSKEDVISVYS